MWISPSYQDSDFHHPLSHEDKITIFEDRVLGWKLDIADQVINGQRRPNGGEARQPIPHSGYATLDIIFSYFEMIAKYENGFADIGESRNFFKQGVFYVFPDLRRAQVPANIPGVQGKVVSLIDYVLDVMYKGVRCGLYHSGVTDGRVVLTGEIANPLALDPQNMVLVINPHLLVPALKTHFANYINRLKDSGNQELRQNFEARFDFDTGF